MKMGKNFFCLKAILCSLRYKRAYDNLQASCRLPFIPYLNLAVIRISQSRTYINSFKKRVYKDDLNELRLSYHTHIHVPTHIH